MARKELVRRFVLNEIGDDYENLEHIRSLMAKDAERCGLTISTDEIVQSLADLIQSGLAKAYRFRPPYKSQPDQIPRMPPLEEIREYYFWATPEGRDLQVSDSLAMVVNPANNQIQGVYGVGYDANGNQAGMWNGTERVNLNYDVENRLVSAGNYNGFGPSIMSAYDAQNRRNWIWTGDAYALGDPVNGNDADGLATETCGQIPISGGPYNGQTVGQVMTGTTGNDLLAQEIWHEGGTIYSSDLTSPAANSAYEQDLTGIGTAILNQWDVDDGRLTVYQNGNAVCPLGQCLDRSLAQIIEGLATYRTGRGGRRGRGRLTHVFNSQRADDWDSRRHFGWNPRDAMEFRATRPGRQWPRCQSRMRGRCGLDWRCHRSAGRHDF
jgi:hypothetical protein